MIFIKKRKAFVGIALGFAFIGILQSCDSKSKSTEDGISYDIGSVTAENKELTTVAVVEPTLPSPSASINKVWITQSQYYKTVVFHADFDVNNMLNKTGSFVVYITNQFTHDKPFEVYGYDTFTPSYENSHYSDFKYTIEKEQLTKDFRFDGETHFKAYIKIYDDKERLLGTSEYASFTIEQDIQLFY